MKKTGLGLVFAFLLVGVYLALKPSAPVYDGVIVGLPWQIKVLADGRSEVFGLILEGSTLQQADTRLGNDRELAVLVGKDQQPRLEMYYQKFKAGPVSGYLILSFAAEAEDLRRLIGQRTVSEYTSSGSRKYKLGADDRAGLESLLLQQMLFIPSINLDASMIEGRFGVPESKESTAPHLVRYFYPQQGLEIALHEESKEVLRYVAPRSWSK